MSITRQELPNEPEVDLEDFYDRQYEMYIKKGLSEEEASENATQDCQEEEREILARRRCCPNGCKGRCE